MTRIKIISDPYKRKISFYKWSEEDQLWNDITILTDPNSNLLKDDIKSGFFPFIVKKIVDIIVEEYSHDEELLELVFEGTADEFKEIENVCSEEDIAKKVKLSKSELFLENARDILPEIREIYKSIEPIIKISVLNEKEKLEREIQKFTDASR